MCYGLYYHVRISFVYDCTHVVKVWATQRQHEIAKHLKSRVSLQQNLKHTSEGVSTITEQKKKKRISQN